jgi:hypothetical protein
MATFGTYSNIGQPVMQTMGAPMTTMSSYSNIGQPVMQTMGAPMTTKSYGQPMLQTMAAPAVEYIQQAPMAEYIQQAPMVEYIQQAPMVEYIEQPRVLQSAPVAPRNLLAMGNVVSERVITIDELASMDRYAEAEAVMVHRGQFLQPFPYISVGLDLQSL